MERNNDQKIPFWGWGVKGKIAGKIASQSAALAASMGLKILNFSLSSGGIPEGNWF